MESLRTKASVKLFAILPIGIFFLVLVQHSPVLVSAQTGAEAHLSHREVKNLVQTATTRADHLRNLCTGMRFS